MSRITFVNNTAITSSPVSDASEIYLGHYIPKTTAPFLGARFFVQIWNNAATSTASCTLYIRELTKAALPYLPTFQNTINSAGTLATWGVGAATGTATGTFAAAAAGYGPIVPPIASLAFTQNVATTRTTIWAPTLVGTSTATNTNIYGAPLTCYGFIFSLAKSTKTDTIVQSINIMGQFDNRQMDR